MSRRSRRQRLPVEPITLHVTSLSHEGRGVANRDGKVCFVAGALPGEEVSARYVNRRRQFDELLTEEVLQASAERVTPPCVFAGQCGGCSLQHLETGAQLAFKESVLLEHLSHHAGLEADAFELLPRLSGATEHYRRKARLAVRVVAKKGGALVGFRKKHSSFITDMDSCRVLVAEASDLIAPLRELIDALAASRDIPQIEVAAGERDADSDALQLALIVRHLVPLLPEDIALLEEFAAQWQVDLYLQPGGVDSVHKLYPAHTEPRLQYFLPEHDLRLRFHPMDFTQINGLINRRIIDQALGQLALNDTDRVLDLFCGLGNFTLPAARQAARVVGVEGSAEMVARGRENAQLNGLDNIDFHAADLTRPINDQSWAQQPFDKVILDPPRSGALEIIEQIADLNPARIVYVSCNPVTLARDASRLLARGYKLKSAGVMDMFPHTAHVESMAAFERA
ncbi:MAG: 23S rRNA (uracil(1939)-C(5))-methyltransferase RlmD [Pseudohongiellaceae bacterium]